MNWQSIKKLTRTDGANTVHRLLIVVWALMMCLIGATLMAGHWIVLPHPEPGQQADWPSPQLDRDSQFLACHFLYTECPCSRRVWQHVARRSPVMGVQEHVILISKAPREPEQELAANMEAKGYEVTHVTPENLKRRFGIESAPLMVVVDHENRIHYSGGYTFRKQGPVIQDQRILESLVLGEPIDQLPVFGCAVSNELQLLVDPLRLKYGLTSKESARD